MATAQPDRNAIRRLAEADVRGCPVLSVYVNLDPAEFATGATRSSALKSVIDEAARAADDEEHDLSHDARAALRGDVQRLRDYLGSVDFAGTRGLAIFVAGGAGLFEAIHLPYPVESSVVVNSAPHVAPIASQAEGDWCVALVSRRNGRILRGGPERLVEVGDVSDDVHGQHDQGGWSQARYQRSVDLEVTRHVERLARILSQGARAAPFEHLLIGGPEDAYTELVEMLDEHLRERLRGRVETDVDDTTADQVRKAALPLMQEHERRSQDELLARLQERIGRGDRAAAGLDDVLGCLNEQRVETLLLDAGFSAQGSECPSCGWIGSIADGGCPMDGARLDHRPDVVDPAIDRAFAQDARVVTVRERPEIQLHGGIAAILRF
ncbi:MAG: Vms1/Ankzf1 family peptidyl-tRNA hydrolase [Thermoleophilaceae bacterium]